MGGQSSKGQVVSTKPAPHQPQGPPYPGPCAQYQFVNTQVSIATQLTFSFLQSQMITSNIDQYYPALASQYQQGYRLLSFYRIPGQQQQQGLFNPSIAVGFVGIFCRYPSAPPRENVQLRIEKSVMQMQRMFTGIISFNQGTVTDTSHILDSIARNTQDGGRLICVEVTGQQHRQNLGMAMQGVSPMMGVDLFFDVPSTPTPEKYVYNCVSVPISVTVRMGFPPVPVIQCDWVGNLAHNLNQGWRLIEVFMDMSSHTQMQGFGGQTTLNSVWFFEKPMSRMHDPTPLYQGTIVDHVIKIKGGFGGSHCNPNWEPVIQEMGNQGWELACILETPDQRQAGLASITMTCKLFFQRPLLHLHQQAAGPAPPSYNAAVGGGGYGGPAVGGQGYGPGPSAGAAAPAPAAPAPAAGFNVGPPPPQEKTGF